MLDLPLRFKVTRERPGSGKPDKLGNIKYSKVVEEVPVAGWYVPSSDETIAGRNERRTVEIVLIGRSGDFKPEDVVNIEGYPERLKVDGFPRNYDHNPFGWSPGFEIVDLKRTT